MLSPVVLALFQAPYNMGPLVDADTIGCEGSPGEGPHMVVYLRMAGDRIGEAGYETYGCPNAIACGSWVTRWVAGRTPDEARILEAEDLRQVLGGLPLGKEHCADLAVEALRTALRKVDVLQVGGSNVRQPVTGSASVGRACRVPDRSLPLAERRAVRDAPYGERFHDHAPTEVVATLLDEGNRSLLDQHDVPHPQSRRPHGRGPASTGATPDPDCSPPVPTRSGAGIELDWKGPAPGAPTPSM